MKPVIAMPKLSNDPFRIYMKSKYVFSLWRSGARVRWIGNENTESNRRALSSAWCPCFYLFCVKCHRQI